MTYLLVLVLFLLGRLSFFRRREELVALIAVLFALPQHVYGFCDSLNLFLEHSIFLILLSVSFDKVIFTSVDIDDHPRVPFSILFKQLPHVSFVNSDGEFRQCCDFLLQIFICLTNLKLLQQMHLVRVVRLPQLFVQFLVARLGYFATFAPAASQVRTFVYTANVRIDTHGCHSAARDV